MKHKSVKVLQAVDSGNELLSVVPAGDYYVGDPCYVLSDELYKEIGALIFPDHQHDGRDVELEVELEDGTKVRLVDWRTAYGDGRYDVLSEKGLDSVCVDSGGLAVIDTRLLSKHKYDDEGIKRVGHFETLAGPTLLKTQGGDARMVGYFTLCTEDSKDGDDD